MKAYYNEFDKNAAAWLRELISDGLIAYGDVDERSIIDVDYKDLEGYTQHHFFAGIGGWSYALRIAAWPDDAAVWTASLPCQPFSAAGKGLGKADERHLLPHFLELVKQCKPKTIFGEQVERAIGSTGVRDQTKDLRSLQTRAAYLRVLAELQRQGGKTLQELQSMGEGKQTHEKRKKFFGIPVLEIEESGCGISELCRLSSQRKGDGIRYNCGLGASQDRCRSMRSDWDSIRSNYSESVERSVTGQDRQQQGVHNNEYPCGDLRLECNDEYLGTAKDIGSIEWNNESAQESLSIAYRAANEQIEGAIGHGWLDDLQTTMEAEGYAVGHCVLGAHSVIAAHIRQRLYWVANYCGERLEGRERTECADKFTLGENGLVDWVADSIGIERTEQGNGCGNEKDARQAGGVNAYGCEYESYDWLYCRDGKFRPIESGLKPLVDGVPRGVVHSSDPRNTQEARAMRLKGYGNAIVPKVAAEFISAFMDTDPLRICGW